MKTLLDITKVLVGVPLYLVFMLAVMLFSLLLILWFVINMGVLLLWSVMIPVDLVSFDAVLEWALTVVRGIG